MMPHADDIPILYKDAPDERVGLREATGTQRKLRCKIEKELVRVCVVHGQAMRVRASRSDLDIVEAISVSQRRASSAYPAVGLSSVWFD